MIRVAVDIPGNFLRSGILCELQKTGLFSASEADHNHLALSCRSQQSEILLLGVSRLCGYSIDDRRAQLEALRRDLPTCKTVLLIEEETEPETRIAIDLKKIGLTDAFLFQSVGFPYLISCLAAL